MSLLDLLQSRTLTEFESRKASARKQLESIFPNSLWGVDLECSEYTDDNINNLWNNELRKPIRHRLESSGLSKADYETWLGDIHFINIGIYRKSVFPAHKSNIGWRIAVLAIPAAHVVATGIASHYQGGQRHAQLGLASNLLFDAAQDGLAASGTGTTLPGRKVNADDWDRDGLIEKPILDIAGVDLSTVPGVDHLILKDVRTTTAKKIIASYITIEPHAAGLTEPSLLDSLRQLEKSGSALASGVYPFRSTDEFEPVRSLALQDLAAASLRLQLRRKSSTRSAVRIYHGPPGTGKTLAAVREAVKLADPAFNEKEGPEAAFARFNELGGQVAFITFHPALQYEDVIESIRPIVGRADEASIGGDSGEQEDSGDDDVGQDETEAEGNLAYRIHEGLFLRMIRKAAQDPNKEFVIVIDEINRGDVSRILGPLLSALEADKRVGAEFPIGVELQYPRAEQLESRLYLPPNIHFLGTMNSADRNIALVDHALRRRFDFIGCPPEPALLGSATGTEPIDMSRLLDTLNARIEHLLDADHCIGHGYFMGCKTSADLIEVFARKIVPLLIEYFYGNAGLMLLVLGDAPGGPYNILQVIEPEASFDKVFNIDRDIASKLGYRAHEVALGFRLEPRFWDQNRAIPGPQDEAYAARAIRKIYEAVAVAPPSENG
ncbi:AAA family ATPase [Mesorhizobium sp. M0976]|uniref:McrB family protein n=1 Tax=Mesorhizobium sp. M0976 TaxID=2957038 RepID=UPI00333BCCED